MEKRKFFNLAAIGLVSAATAFGLHAGSAVAGAEGVQVSQAEAAGKNLSRGNEMPDANEFTGLSRKVLQYSEAFAGIVERARDPDFSDADWAPLEALVATDDFVRMGVFLTDRAEVIGWEQYKQYITQYAAGTSWEGTLRRITEVPGLVILELEERNTLNGVTSVANTVTIYEFDDQGKIHHLDVYVMPLHTR